MSKDKVKAGTPNSAPATAPKYGPPSFKKPSGMGTYDASKGIPSSVPRGDCSKGAK